MQQRRGKCLVHAKPNQAELAFDDVYEDVTDAHDEPSGSDGETKETTYTDNFETWDLYYKTYDGRN